MAFDCVARVLKTQGGAHIPGHKPDLGLAAVSRHLGEGADAFKGFVLKDFLNTQGVHGVFIHSVHLPGNFP